MAHLTDELISKLAAGKRCVFLWDESVSGFGVKVTPTGRKVFILQYRLAMSNSTTRRHTIGAFGGLTEAQARAFAMQLKRKIAHGVDPKNIKYATGPRRRNRSDLSPAKPGSSASTSQSRDFLQEAILAGASRVFIRDGYSGTIDAVAEQAGVSRQTIFNYFGSKNQLVHAVIEYATSQIMTAYDEFHFSGNVLEDLREYGRLNAKGTLSAQGTALTSLAVSARNVNPRIGREVYDTGTYRVIKRLSNYFAQKVAEGVLLEMDCDSAAEQFIALTIGMSRSRQLYGITQHLNERLKYVDRAVSTFVRGVMHDRIPAQSGDNA